jgi:hypothetical protein
MTMMDGMGLAFTTAFGSAMRTIIGSGGATMGIIPRVADIIAAIVRFIITIITPTASLAEEPGMQTTAVNGTSKVAMAAVAAGAMAAAGMENK